MRDFSKVADYLIPRRKRIHISVFIFTILMIPGILATFEPIDIESYEMESPELDANMVFREEFTAAGNIWGFGIFVRGEADIGSPESDVSMIADYTGENSGLEFPKGGILNLTVLREIDINAETLRTVSYTHLTLPTKA